MLALCLLYSSVFGRFANFQLVFIKRFRLSAQSPPFFPQRAPGLARGGEQGLRGNSLKGAIAVQSLAGIVWRREKGTNERTHCYSRRRRRRGRERGREWLACRESTSRIRRPFVLPPSLPLPPPLAFCVTFDPERKTADCRRRLCPRPTDRTTGPRRKRMESSAFKISFGSPKAKGAARMLGGVTLPSPVPLHLLKD